MDIPDIPPPLSHTININDIGPTGQLIFSVSAPPISPGCTLLPAALSFH